MVRQIGILSESFRDRSIFCFTSPLKRAKETAELILTGRDVPIVDEMRIVEMSFAEWEGKHCSKERWEVPDSFQKFFDDPANFEPAPDGESFAQVKARTGEFLQWLYNESSVKDYIVPNDRWGIGTRGHHGGNFTTEYDNIAKKKAEFITVDPNKPFEECRGMGRSFGLNRIENTDDYMSAKELMSKFGVSNSAAKKRLTY